ncbi:hypothetical protein NV379_06960 [Paenibacillus sp. N1-5-1-14]|uniref:hypothetical protein n=1 Tax=Paenibacillus radicibacter TaxID=2972488 RepID=UPI00215914D2|nr:hypothetical protein [Paenibacillus radicibacter]MCR8642399.1 hypothetical protein [Paenibacillus radicibacter]
MRKKHFLLILLCICASILLSACTNKEEKIQVLKSEIDELVRAEKYEEAIQKYSDVLVISDEDTYKKERDVIIKKNEDLKIEKAKKEEERKKAEEAAKKAAEIPEPYKKGIDSFTKGDMEIALKYLDMTISDFGDTPFKLKAYILKSHILSVQYLTKVATYGKVATGAIKLFNSGLGESSDRSKVKTMLANLETQYKETEAKLTESVTYVLENYHNLKENEMINPPITYHSSFSNPSQLDFFTKIGYPIPDDDKVLAHEKDLFELILNEETKNNFQENKINFVNFFYNMSFKSSSKLYKSTREVVLKLTENDKYNEIRLKAEEDLKKIKQ